MNFIFITQFHNKIPQKLDFFLSNFWGAVHKGAFLYFNALLFTAPAVGFYYVYDFISRFKDLLGQSIGGEIFKIIFAGLLLGVAFVVFNQNNFVRILKLSQRFEEGKISVICRADDDPDVYLEVNVGPDGAIVTKELHDYKTGA